MKRETDVLAACSFSLILSLLEQRSKSQKQEMENEEATMVNVQVSNSPDHLEVEVKSIFNLRPEEGGPKEIGKLQFIARLWQHGTTEEQVVQSQVFPNPGQDIIFDMDPEKEPEKLVLKKQGQESGWVVLEVHRLSRIPGKKSHLLGEVVIFVEGTQQHVDGEITHIEDRVAEHSDSPDAEQEVQTNGTYQVMVFPAVINEGEVGEELTRRNDQTTKRFLARYDKS